MSKYTRDSQEWLPDEEIELLVVERIARPEMTDAEQARDILTKAAPKAAASVAWLALYSNNENVRLRASQYIIDGVVGGTFKGTGGEDDVLMALVNKLAENDPAPQGKIY